MYILLTFNLADEKGYTPQYAPPPQNSSNQYQQQQAQPQYFNPPPPPSHPGSPQQQTYQGQQFSPPPSAPQRQQTYPPPPSVPQDNNQNRMSIIQSAYDPTNPNLPPQPQVIPQGQGGSNQITDTIGSFNGGSYRIDHRDSNTLLTLQLAHGCPVIAKPGILHLIHHNVLYALTFAPL